MRNIAVLLFLSIILLPLTAFGQFDGVGLKLGAQSAGVYGNQVGDSRVGGFSVYLFAERNMSERLFITADLGFTRRGFTDKKVETNQIGEIIQTVEATSRLSYLSLASFVNVRFPLGSLPLYAGLGPRLDLLIDRSTGTFEFTTGSVEDQTVNALDDVVAGGSLVTGLKDLSIGGLKFRVEVKYEADITNSLGPALAFRNNVLMLLIGFQL